MDVVKRNIESIRGKVEVHSKAGSGTDIILRIPLTLATIDGMLVKVNDVLYTIPIVSIKESLKITEDQITQMADGQEVVRIRRNLLPVVKLSEFYRLERNGRRLTDGILIVVENDEKVACLFVDDVLGQQQVVIKRIPSYFGDIEGFPVAQFLVMVKFA